MLLKKYAPAGYPGSKDLQGFKRDNYSDNVFMFQKVWYNSFDFVQAFIKYCAQSIWVFHSYFRTHFVHRWTHCHFPQPSACSSSVPSLKPKLPTALTIQCELLFIHSFIFRERVREGEREGEKHQCVIVSHEPPTGDLAHNPGVCPDWESNWRPLGLKAGTQSAEPHLPGQNFLI